MPSSQIRLNAYPVSISAGDLHNGIMPLLEKETADSQRPGSHDRGRIIGHIDSMHTSQKSFSGLEHSPNVGPLGWIDLDGDGELPLFQGLVESGSSVVHEVDIWRLVGT